VPLVGHDATARVDVGAADAAMFAGRGHDAAGEALAEAGDQVGGARGQLTDGRDAVQDLVQAIEALVDGVRDRDDAAAHQLRRGIQVPRAQLGGDAERCVHVVVRCGVHGSQ
jgi:hypothetical protein